MKFWMSAEIQADVYDQYCEIARDLESAINAWLEKRDYGPEVRKWAMIAIIMDEPGSTYVEVEKFHRKTRVVEFRYQIDHKLFRKSNSARQRLLFGKILVRSLTALTKMKLGTFQSSKLESDFRDWAKSNGCL